MELKNGELMEKNRELRKYQLEEEELNKMVASERSNAQKAREDA